MKNLLFIGGTGYIGGPLLSRFLENNDPDLNITALVRSPEKAAKLRALNLRLNIVSGSQDDAELSTLIHMSGTGILADDAKGTLSEKIYNDTDVEALPATQPHRNVDLAIVNADTQGYIYSYIVIPGIPFGSPGGVLAETRVQNPKNLIFTFILSASFARCSAGYVGARTNRMGVVDVNETADIVEILYTAAVAGRASHGKHGYYFITNGDVAWGEIADVVATRAGAPRPFTQEDLDTYYPGMPGLHRVLGNNGRANAERARALGWKPVKST
ncbi:hypothetical protein DFH06DRAFT_1328832 [Mycena polygramma]|nr:hypothetical protein DFH06DRAFT_1328832 [Mycena polygramma]